MYLEVRIALPIPEIIATPIGVLVGIANLRSGEEEAVGGRGW